MKNNAIVLLSMTAVLASCAQASAIRVSQNQMMIQSNAAPVCGGIGAMKVAERQAAIETIKAGFDRYIITNGASENNVSASQMPGTFNTYGSGNGFGGYHATTTYTPGPVVFSGTHDQALNITMFKDGQAGASNAISAREILGPKWAEIVKHGVMTCTN